MKFASEIIKNDTKLDWTKDYSKKEIEEMCKEYIEISKKNLDESKKRNIKFIDTSINRNNVLNNLLNEILSLINTL